MKVGNVTKCDLPSSGHFTGHFISTTSKFVCHYLGNQTSEPMWQICMFRSGRKPH